MSGSVFANILPENDLYIGTDKKSANGITEEKFNQAIEPSLSDKLSRYSLAYLMFPVINRCTSVY